MLTLTVIFYNQLTILEPLMFFVLYMHLFAVSSTTRLYLASSNFQLEILNPWPQFAMFIDNIQMHKNSYGTYTFTQCINYFALLIWWCHTLAVLIQEAENRKKVSVLTALLLPKWPCSSPEDYIIAKEWRLTGGAVVRLSPPLHAWCSFIPLRENSNA